nr:hypothetical protein [Tanacetum cinerariifolium]
TSVLVKKVNDVPRLQALVDKKKVIITEATIRDALRLNDAESIYCLPNEEIFAELSRIGYKTPFTKLTFYKAFFSPQWNLVRNVDRSTKLYLYPRFLQLMIRAQIGDLSSHTTKYSSLALTQKVFANMRMVGKGFAGVDTPLFEGMLVAQQVDESTAEVNVDDVSATGVVDKGAADLRRLKKVGTAQRVETSDDTIMDDVSKQGMIIADMDADVDVTLKDIAKDVAVDAEIEERVDVQGRQAESQAQIYQIDLEHADKVLSMQDDEVEPAVLQEVVEKSLNLSRRKLKLNKMKLLKRELEAELNKNVDWDEVIDQVKRKEKEDNVVMSYQALKRKPQTEAQARKNMMIYLRNMAGFKMDYFKGMTYDDIRLIFEKNFNSNIVPNDDDDVYTEATPLALKVPVVDYEIYTENNKPYYKIKRADGSHQNFSDDFLMTTLGAMLEKPNV